MLYGSTDGKISITKRHSGPGVRVAVWTTETVEAGLDDAVLNLDREQTLGLIALLEESLENSDDERTKLEQALKLEDVILEALPAAVRAYASLSRIVERDATFLKLQNELLDLLDSCLDHPDWHTGNGDHRKRLHGLATINAHYLQEHYLSYTGCFELTSEGGRS